MVLITIRSEVKSPRHSFLSFLLLLLIMLVMVVGVAVLVEVTFLMAKVMITVVV